MAIYDLLLSGGTLLDPAQSIHAPRDVAFAGGRVAALAERIDPATAREVLDCSGRIVAPGLIDLHVHIFPGVSHYGIEPDPHCIARGVTTAVDAGAAGADTFPGFRKYVIEASATRLFAQLRLHQVQGLAQAKHSISKGGGGLINRHSYFRTVSVLPPPGMRK